MAWNYEAMTPTPIENVTVEKGYLDGVHKIYRLKANEGYVLHDAGRDWTEIDPETEEEIIKLGYTAGTTTCNATYNFTLNPREYYAVLASTVPADQIFGTVNNDHEVM